MSKLVSVRGAITAENTEKSIAEASVRLIDRMYFKNGLSDENVVNIVFSSTADITAYYPARAVREAGRAVPLFSCLEPNIADGAKHCIRAMITAYSDKQPHSVYLNGARKLRPDIAKYYAIALDGPSGAGKSTVAKAVSRTLGITYLDTGALYRALGLKAVRDGVCTTDHNAVEKSLSSAVVGLEYNDGVQHVYLNAEDVTPLIREHSVSKAASDVSAMPFVREKLLDTQRNIAKNSSVILDGRDIGTVVLPDAEFKFYLTASAEIRAKRRYDELIEKGESITYEKVLSDVNARDLNDSTRKIAPLRKAFDAVEIDSGDMSAKEVVDYIISAVEKDVKA